MKKSIVYRWKHQVCIPQVKIGRFVSFKHEEEGRWIEVISALRSKIPGMRRFAKTIVIPGRVERKLMYADALPGTELKKSKARSNGYEV